jgi:ubiquinol oxidase
VALAEYMEDVEAPIGFYECGQPPELTAGELRWAQAQTLDSSRLKYSLLARMLFKTVDLVYGRQRSLVKFAMLEFIARVPYQAWERMGYLALARRRRDAGLARRILDRIEDTRAQQDSEEWHLLIVEDLVRRQGAKQSFLRHRVAPWIISVVNYHISWMVFLVKPTLSYRLNAEFEDHAEHEYMLYVAEHPELERQPDPGTYGDRYGCYASVADLLRQIGHDERVHKEDSQANLDAPRFHDDRQARHLTSV